MGSQATPRSCLPSWDGSHHLSPEEGGLPGCSRGGGLQTGLAAWVSLSGFPAQISGTEACYWQNLEIAGGFHCLGLGSPGVGDADDVLVGRGSEKRLGLAIMSVPSSWSSGTRGGHVQVLAVPRPPPLPCPLCLLTQSAGEKETSRWLPLPHRPPTPTPPRGMEPLVNKAPGSDNLQSRPHSCSWLASLPIPGLAAPWAPPSPSAQLLAGTVCQYSGWSVRELRPSNRTWARLLQSSEPEGGKTAERAAVVGVSLGKLPGGGNGGARRVA